MSDSSLTPLQVWMGKYDCYEFKDPDENVEFKDLFDRHLQKGGTCFEIGCYPGRYLAYLGKRFNYTVSGIDFIPNYTKTLQERLSNYGVRVGNLIEGDFLGFKSDLKYDVVCSFGFIEHFLDTKDMIERHLDLLNPGGILFISCPNFKKVQYLLHRWLDERNLKQHNIGSMDFEKWTSVLLANDMEILHQGYYGTAGFWVGKAGVGESRWRSGRNLAALSLTYIMRFIDKIVDYPNSVLSPSMVSISKRKNGF